jgi:enamine deaminase RidA (YjgF/YER057c/UK114 family)
LFLRELNPVDSDFHFPDRLLAALLQEVVAIDPDLDFDLGFDRQPNRMTPQQKAESLGIVFTKQPPAYLNLCIRSGNQLMTSGHVSDLKGKLGADLSTDVGYQAARNCAEKVLRSVWDTHGTLDGLKVIKVLGCVNSTLDYTEQHLVINGCSDLLHEIFGKDGDGWHARSALGFAQLPTGAAVEVEAIFEIKS